MKRFRATLAVVALLAIAILLFRPMMLDVIGAPYGAHNSPDVQLMGADGSPHCQLLADCETVSISNVGLDFALTGAVLILSGVVMTVAASRARVLHSWPVLVPNPPPLFAPS